MECASNYNTYITSEINRSKINGLGGLAVSTLNLQVEGCGFKSHSAHSQYAELSLEDCVHESKAV